MSWFELPKPFWKEAETDTDTGTDTERYSPPLPGFPQVDATGIDRWLLPDRAKLVFKQEISVKDARYKYKMYVYSMPSWISFDVAVMRVNIVSGSVEDVITLDAHGTVPSDEVIFALPQLTECLHRYGGYEISLLARRLRNTWAWTTADAADGADGDNPDD
jgi:hypothetical protein